VRDQFFFLSVAGLGMSVAGFAGLVSAFRRGEAWDRVELWRLRSIARLSFLVVFLGLAVFPVYTFLGDEAATIRSMSAAIVGLYVIEIVLARRDTVNWPTRTWLVSSLLADGVFAAINAVNVVVGLTALLEVGLLLRLVHPVNLFLLVLRSFEPPVRDV
jgi:hypothetical protein